MGKQANILSFDDAKRESGAWHPSAAASRKTARRRSAGAAVQGGSSARTTTARRSTAASRYAGISSSDRPLSSRSTARAAEAGPRAYPRAAVTTFDTRESRSGRNGSVSRSTRGAHAKLVLADEHDERDEQIERTEEEAVEKRSRLAEFRHKRRKECADKKFNKQFGDARPAGDTPSGSRAAVYKTEMGTAHKRAARMQNSPAAAAGVAVAKFNPAAALSSWKQSPKVIASMAVVVCLALTCWFLYTPTQQFYQSVREQDRLEAEYAAIEQRNASLQSEVNALGTDAGIGDRAHEQFGWVPEGYETANVKGLSSSSDNSSGFTANIVPGSIKAPETWYSPFLDALFGVK